MNHGRSTASLFVLLAATLRCSSGTQGAVSGGSDASEGFDGSGGAPSGQSSGDSDAETAPDVSSGPGGGDAGGVSDGGGVTGETGTLGDAATALDTGGAAVGSLEDANLPERGDGGLPDKDACATGSPVAFPGAVGFGAAATGGRGSAAYHVTTLDDTGATGSLRDAVSTGPRTIVFDVGGIINLTSALSCAADLTIAGQTAPGGGIAIEGREVSFSNSSNEIVRNIRVRQGTDDPDTGKSGIAADSDMNLIFDHVSVEFSDWDNLDINSGGNVTFQRSILADPIGQQFNAHVDSTPITWFENIFANAHNRNPLAKGDTQYVNNVVYNFQSGYTLGDTGGKFMQDVVNNYFIVGPSTTNSGDAFFQLGSQSMYFEGNMLDTTKGGTLNGSAMSLPGGITALSAPYAPTTSSFDTASAAEGYAYDVAHSGALPRDDVDTLVLADVTSLGTSGHLWTTQTATGLANGGYGTLAGGTPPVDTDGDGIPDAWETAHGLNPNDAADAILYWGCSGYTNLEVYLNQLADSLTP
jgi:hypothetical protein